MKTLRAVFISCIIIVSVLFAAGLIGLLVQMYEQQQITGINKKTQRLGVHFTNGRREAFNCFSIACHDKQFGDDEMEQLILLLKDWLENANVQNYSIDMRGTSISDQGFLLLTKFNKIESVHISGQYITKKGVCQFLQQYNAPCNIFYSDAKDNVNKFP